MSDARSDGVQRGQLALSGPLVLAGIGRARVALMEALSASDALVVDLSAVERIDTAGVQLLLSLMREASLREKSVQLVRPSAPLTQVLALLRLTESLSSAESGAR